jgi:hypothetical protein
MASELGCKWIAAEATDEAHRITQPGDCHSLVCPLAAGMNLEVRSDHSLTHGWNYFSDRNEISIDTSDDDDWLFARPSSI